jgi:hypothetical protein
MSEFTEISNTHGQPTFHFMHQGQEYFIYFGIDPSDNTIQKARLAIPMAITGGYGANTVYWRYASDSSVVSAGGTNAFMKDVFLPGVNTYLAEQTGETPEFPSDGSDLEQFNWIVENGLSYSNGVVSMS